MKAVIAGMVGASGILAFSQLGGANLDQMIHEEMGMTEPMTKAAVQAASGALGQGADVSFTVLAVAAMPVVFHVVKAGLAMLQQEHDLSVARRRKAVGLHPEPPE